MAMKKRTSGNRIMSILLKVIIVIASTVAGITGLASCIS